MTIANRVPVSVIVNTVDRADSLATLLAALEHQSYSHFEVIVVVGPTQDHTLRVLEPYAARVRVLRCARANLSESRNVGLLAARGEIVAFIDDDAVPSYHWLAQVVAAFEDPAVAVVAGSVYLIHPEHPAIQHWLGMMSDLGEQQDVRLEPGTKPQGMGVFWTERPMGTNMSLRRRPLLAAGGFDSYFEWVFDDADVAMRLAMAGHPVRSLTEAPVYHIPASSRNRVVRTYSGRWWIVTKASTYFAMQNGRAAGQPFPQILLRIGHQVHGAWLGNWQLFHHGHIGGGEMWKRRLRAVAAGAQGAVQGLGRRKLLPEAARTPQEVAGTAHSDRFLSFPTAAGAHAPAVDPISGAHGKGPFTLPPLRIGIIGQPFCMEDGADCALIKPAARSLFQLGHTVHVLTAAAERTIIFEDGAYIHAELLSAGDQALYGGIERLVENDGIQLLVGRPANLAAAAGVAAIAGGAMGDPRPDVQHALQPLLAAGWTIVAVGAKHATAHPDSSPSSGVPASPGRWP